MTVDELTRAAAGGDEAAFEELVRLHEKKVYNLALRMCGSPEDAADEAPSPQARAEGEELRGAVLSGLAQLSDDHRQALTLRELQELSYEEIAAVLEIDLGTVKSRISRARGALRKILLKNGNLSGYLPSKIEEQPKGGDRT